MKILGSDFDGTLNHGGIDEGKLAAIRKWREAGNLIGVISGRGVEFRGILSKRFPELELDFLAVCNGGYVMNWHGAVIYEKRCGDVPFFELASDLMAWGCKVVHMIGEQYFCVLEREEDRPERVEESRVRLLKSNPTVPYFYQVSVRRSTTEKASAVVERVREKYGAWLTPLQNGLSVDIVPNGVNKAEGLYRVMEWFGGAREDVIAVGDNVNDMDMIREFRSYAMENGVEELKREADGMVSDVTELIERELCSVCEKE